MKQKILLACLLATALLLSLLLYQDRGGSLAGVFASDPAPASLSAAPLSSTKAAVNVEPPLPPGTKLNLSPEDQVEFAEMPPMRPFKLITKEMGKHKEPKNEKKRSP